MSRKTTAALVAALGINFALAGGALMLANLNKPAAFNIEDAFAQENPGDLTSVADRLVDAQAGELAVPLAAAQQGGNTRIVFRCGKDTGGGTREVHEGTWDQIGGAILYHPDQQTLLAVEAVFDTRSLRTDAQALTTTVTTKEKWFDIDNHPQATFKCDSVEAVATEGATHTHELAGSFTLNGITKPITIPATLSFSGQSLQLDAAFTILRSDFEVDKRSSSIAGTLGSVVTTVEDEVQLTVRVTASPDPAAVIGELAQVIESQREDIRILRQDVKQAQDGLRFFADRADELEQRLEEMKFAVVKDVDLSQIPQAYADHAAGSGGPVPFEMVLVPGDASKGIEPFYMAKHEVTWEMFRYWMYCEDLKQAGVSASEIAQLIANGARPSPLYEDPAQLFEANESSKPAMGMTLLSAKSYCKWLSETTGRRYRLATINEWQHAMRLGGGLPDDLEASVWHKGNAPKDFFDRIVNSSAGAKAPNTLGIHDMFGSVAEWVTGTGKDRVIVGGSFLTPPKELSEDWKMVEELEVWSESYPNYPKSRFWYSDIYHAGIRLVCEPSSVAANPPKE